MNLWKRNAVVATVVLFVTMALYLSWSYNRDENAVNGPGWDGDDTVYTLLDVVDAAKTGNTAPPTVSPEVQTDGGAGQNSYFIEQRLSRQKARDGALSILREMAAREGLNEEERARANGEITALATQALTEAKVEGLVVSKGFEDCVVYIGESGISVVVASPSDGLTAADVVKIQDIVVTETDFMVTDIRIMEAGV